MSLKNPHLKMSKSHPDPRSRILLTDSPEEIHQKIKFALTDSNPTASYDPTARPGVSNLIEILYHFEGDGKSCTEFALIYESLSLSDLKTLISEKVSAHLTPIRERYLKLMNGDSDYLDSVAYEGGQAARANADATMTIVRNAVGF
jgi:tryptophanyl-tRNA synthetase